MADNSFDVIVIGAGPGGYVAAIRAAQLGLKTACVEKRATLGGTCLNVGCIPSKALLQSSEHFAQASHDFDEHGIELKDLKVNLGKMMARKEKIVENLTKGIDGLLRKNKITRINGFGTLKSNTEVEVAGVVYQTKNIILATGSEPTPLPFLPFDEQRVLSSTGALSLKEIPKNLIVIGGGVIGVEMGSVFSRLGSKVTVIEFLEKIIPLEDKDVSKEMLRVLSKQGLDFYLKHKVTEAKVVKNQVIIKAEDDKGVSKEFTGDYVLVSIGRRGFLEKLNLDKVGVKTERNKVIVNENFQSSVPNIYAIGDIIDGPMLAHKAEEEGVACAEIIAGNHGHVNYMEIPSIVYTNPEVASVGLTEDECKHHEFPIKIGKFPFKANARAKCVGHDDGFVKIISHAETDRILGVHIIGPGASEMIAEAVVALSFKASAEDIAMICHGHPTLSESFKEAALNVHGRSIHI